MNQVRERADYLIKLMPLLGKGVLKRIPIHGCDVECNVTLGQMHILGFLKNHGPETMGGIAAWSKVAVSTMTENINRLVKLGLVQRVQDPRDRRIVRIRLSPKGQQVFKRQASQRKAVMMKLLQTLPEVEQRKLIGAFKIIESILLKR